MTQPQRKKDAERRNQRAAVALPARTSSPTKLDPLVHERMRLAILGALSTRDALSFRELRTVLETTDGNVSVHCRRLEDAGYITMRKRFEDRVPRTDYSITGKGRDALRRYLAQMDKLISDLRTS